MTAEKVLENYLNAIGGAAQVAGIQTAKISLDANLGNATLTLAFAYDSQNGRYGQKLSIGGNVMQKTTLSNGKGSISAQNNVVEMNPAQLAEAQLNSYLFPEAVYKSKGYTATLDGLKEVDGKPAYKVVFASASGSKLANYYAQDSGLKIKYENPASETVYGDYQAKNGVLLPMAWTIKFPQIPMPLAGKVTSLELNVPVTEGDIN
jgi:hypothetical protein